MSPTRDAWTGRFTDAGCAGVENACCKGDRGPRNDATAPHGHGQLAVGQAPGGGPLPPGPGAGCPGHPRWHEQRARSGAGRDTPGLACALPGLRGETEDGGGRDRRQRRAKRAAPRLSPNTPRRLHSARVTLDARSSRAPGGDSKYSELPKPRRGNALPRSQGVAGRPARGRMPASPARLSHAEGAGPSQRAPLRVTGAGM